jgi:hypothetical protein
MKATHTGTCQLCGRAQKLPNGRLSLHGYEVKWSQFVGDCNGSRALPYELSRDLIDAAIASAQREALALRADADVQAARTDVVWVQHYVKATWQARKSSQRWIPIDIANVDIKARAYEYEGKRHQVGRYSANLQAECNEARAHSLRTRAAGLEEYAAWLIERNKNWQARPEKLVAVA